MADKFLPDEAKASRIAVLKHTVVQPGDGIHEPRDGDVLTLHYTVRDGDGIWMDSSIHRERPLIFTVGAGQIIKGLEDGIRKMTLYEKAVIEVPPRLAYGKEAFERGKIPEQSGFIFEVELMSLVNPVETSTT